MHARFPFPLAALVFALLSPFTAYADATYYVSPVGDDSLNGLSPANAWRTLTKVKNTSFQPGDHILLEGGTTFTDSGLYLSADDTGTAENPIVVGSYGTGRARIKPATDAQHPVFIYNTAGIILENLILEGIGRDTSSRSGVLVYTDLPGNTRLRGVTVRDCEISNVRVGLELGAWAVDSTFSGFNSVLIERLLVHTCRRDGIITYGFSPGSATSQSHRDITIRDCEVRYVTGDPYVTTGHGGSGIILSGVKGGLIDRCYAHHNGGSHGNSSGGGPVGIWTWGADSVVIQRSLVHDQKTKAGVKDGGGFDVDGGSTNVVVQYNYSYNNEGSGYLVAEFDNAAPLDNVVFRHNISWRDARRTANNMAGGFHFWKGTGAGSTVANIEVYHNLVYTEKATGGPAVSWDSGAMSGIRVRNNVFVVSGGARLVEVNNQTARGYFTFQNNAYWAVDGNWSGGWRWGLNTIYGSLSSWRTANGSPETLGGQPVGFDQEPRIASVVSGAQPTSVDELPSLTAFRLLADSPLLDSALDLRLPVHGALNTGSRDFFGLPFPSGRAADVGPNERTAAIIAFRATNGLPADGTGDIASPALDGVPNLLKYAFNLVGTGPDQTPSLATPNARVLQPTGSAGLPRLDTTSAPPGLVLTYIRRRAVSRPDISYTVQFSINLEPNSWTSIQNTSESSTILDEIFERVTVPAPLPTPRTFLRVQVASSAP